MLKNLIIHALHERPNYCFSSSRKCKYHQAQIRQVFCHANLSTDSDKRDQKFQIFFVTTI